MSFKSLILPLAACILMACSTSYEPVVHGTPSGRPEAVFASQSVSKTKQLLINSNVNKGFILVESSDNVLEFKKPPNRQRLSFYFSEFPHTRYPNIRVIYNVFDSDEGARAVASVWTVGSPGTINEYKVAINDQPISLEVQQFLGEIGGVKPGEGTHAYQGEAAP